MLLMSDMQDLNEPAFAEVFTLKPLTDPITKACDNVIREISGLRFTVRLL